MRIKPATIRLAYDVEDFFTDTELMMNEEEKYRRALLDAKLEALKIMAEEFLGLKGQHHERG